MSAVTASITFLSILVPLKKIIQRYNGDESAVKTVNLYLKNIQFYFFAN